MNRKKILHITLLVFASFLLIIIFIIYKWETNSEPCEPDIPERIGDVSENAEWIGGCDGGFWFDVTEIKPTQNIFRIRIFYDYSGKLIIDQYFAPSEGCNEFFSDRNRILSFILDYDYEVIRTRIIGCNFIPLSEKEATLK